MAEGVEKALAWLRNLGTVPRIESLASQSNGSARLKNNAHIHLPPNFSAFDSIEHAVRLAAEQGVAVLGASNYYDYDIYEDFIVHCRQRGIFPLFGLEIISLIDELVKEGVKINDPGNPGKMYICGKGITRFGTMTPEAQRLLTTIRTNDSQRMAKMIAKIEEIFARHGVATGLDEGKVIDRVVARHDVHRKHVCLQERHVCQAFQERLFELVPVQARIGKLTEVFGAPVKVAADDAVKLQNEIRSNLMKSGKPAFVQETFLTFEEAMRLILELGGLPSYPTLADGVKPICPFEEPVEKLIERLLSMGIHCAELIPIRNSPQVLSQYVKTMRSAGLVVTGGTEHNTLDLLPIEPMCANGQPVPDDVKEVFWEGACVVAAHQFLSLHDEVGFVDFAGKPNGKFSTAEKRIAHFRKLGSAVIARYHQTAAVTRQ